MYRVTAADGDLDDTSGNNQLSFSISPLGDGVLSHFTIDPYTGVVSTNHTIDREIRPYYSLTITVQDNPASPLDTPCVESVSINIRVLDLNDNDPICRFNETIIPVLEDLFNSSDVFTSSVLISDLSNSCLDIDLGTEPVDLLCFPLTDLNNLFF